MERLQIFMLKKWKKAVDCGALGAFGLGRLPDDLLFTVDSVQYSSANGQ